MKIYLASPFFNPEQLEREERIKNKLRELGYEVFAPYEHGKLDVDAADELRNKIYLENVFNIEDSDILFAITDGKDIGTIWESGFACGLNRNREKKIKIVYYAETLGNNPFNVMLAKSANVVLTKYDMLDELPVLLENGKKYEGGIQ